MAPNPNTVRWEPDDTWPQPEGAVLYETAPTEWDTYHDEEAPDPSARIFPPFDWSKSGTVRASLRPGTQYAYYVEYGEEPDQPAEPKYASDDLGDFRNRLTSAFSAQIDLLVKKRQSYGSDNLTRDGAIGIVVRAGDKLERLRTMIKADATENADGDSMADAWRDLMGYAVLGLLHHEQEQAKVRERRDDHKRKQEAEREAAIAHARAALVERVQAEVDEKKRQAIAIEAEGDARAADAIQRAIGTHLIGGLSFDGLCNHVVAWSRDSNSKDGWWMREVSAVCADTRNGAHPDGGYRRFMELLRDRNMRMNPRGMVGGFYASEGLNSNG